MKRLKKYWPFMRASIMQMFIYRGTIWLWLIVDVFQFAMMVFLWKAVYASNDVINGFAFTEMLLYYLLTNLFFVFSDVEAIYAVAEEIREGRISLYLTKPISYRLRLYFELLGRSLGILILLLPVVFLTGLTLFLIFDIVWIVTLEQVLIALLYVPLVFTLVFSFSFLFGTFSIYTTNVFGISIFASVFLRAVSGQLIPLAFYPQELLSVLNVLPFRFVSYPPLVLLGKVATADAWVGLATLAAWVVLFVGGTALWFRASLKKMVVFGG